MGKKWTWENYTTEELLSKLRKYEWSLIKTAWEPEPTKNKIDSLLLEIATREEKEKQ